jgi:ABC-type phosphate transport system substrate-binding protein
MARRARHAPALLALVLAFTAGGCGVSLNGASHGGTSTLAADSVSAAGHLPSRPQGEVDIDGRTQGSLTAAAVGAYEGLGARIGVSDHGEAQGFAELCRGQTDVVDSRQPISPAELSICQAEGMQPVQLEVAADGAVLATGGEVDVGADCLTVAQVKQIFQAGSEITNWSQLGYYDVPLRVAGPSEGEGTFGLLGETALGTKAATLADLRGDYDALPSEGAVRNAVTGGASGPTSAQLHSSALASLNALQRAIGEAHGFLHEATFQVAKGIRDRRSAAAQARDSANLARAQANLAALLKDLPAAERYVQQTTLAEERFQSGLGTVGYFSLAYYTSHEEELRPLEIDSGSLRPRLNCIFPSAQTIANGSYPLSRPLLLTVSLQDMRRPEVEDFLRFYLAQAPSLASAAGLAPPPASTLSTEASWLDGKSQPTVVSYAAPGVGGADVAGATQTTTTTASAAIAPQSALVPAGGAGDGVSAADVPTGHAVEPGSASGEAPSSEAPSVGESSPSTAVSQSSQPLIAGQ